MALSVYLPGENIAVCCSVMQCVAVCCSVLQCVAVCCSISYVWPYRYTSQERMLATAASYFVRRCDPTYIQRSIVSVLQCIAVYCSVLQCVGVFRSVSQSVKVRCSVLQCVAVCCSVLQCAVATQPIICPSLSVCCNVLQRVAVFCSVLQFAVLQRVVNFAVCRCNPTYEKP